MSTIDPVELVYAFAALITSIAVWRHGGKVFKLANAHGARLDDQSKVLEEINAAVNNKAPDEPTLREYVVESFQTIGRVERKVDDHAKDSTIHHRATR